MSEEEERANKKEMESLQLDPKTMEAIIEGVVTKLCDSTVAQ